MSEWKELTIYVHGITPERDVKSHSATYDKIHESINKELKRLSKPLLGPAIKVEWGWEKSTGEDKDLAKAERKITDATFGAYKKAKDLTLNPARIAVKNLRYLFLYGIADMFYYVSEDGKKTIRKTVFDKVLSELKEKAKDMTPDEGISLTCIGHSAGTVILHDLLYNIFTRNYTLKTPPPTYKYIKPSLLKEVRDLARANRIRLRKFYTFGSPITPLTFRSNSLIEKVVTTTKKEAFLNPEDIGIVNYTGAINPRWINFWDPDDVIAYPLEFLYDNREKVIKDRCIDVSDLASKAHGKYWTDKTIIKEIAENF